MALGLAPAVAGGDPSGSGRYTRRRVFYVAGSVVGALGTSVVVHVALRAMAPSDFWWMCSAIIAGVYAGASALHVRLPLLQRSWQVPQVWYSRFGDAAFLAYGGTLGASVLTPILYPSLYVMLSLQGAVSLPAAAISGAGYGLLRGMAVSAGFLSASMDDLGRLVSARDVAERLVVACLALVSTAALVAALT
jgi:hypothetical protein